MNFTPEQQRVINMVEKSPSSLCIEAVAGSGKTTTLAYAARKLDPSLRILALAFNKETAETMSRKFPRHIECRTFNSLGHAIWATYAGRKRLDSKKTGRLVTEHLASLSPTEREEYWPKYVALLTAVKTTGLLPEEIDKDILIEYVENNGWRWQDCFLEVRVLLDRSIMSAHTSCIDFDDQVYMPVTHSIPWPTYDIVLVDEAQDLSPLQHRFVEKLQASRVIAVGDSHQAIYGWRGAHTDSMARLCRTFSMERLPLTACFRCPQKVIRKAQEVVPHIRGFKPEEGICKNLGTPRDGDGNVHWTLADVPNNATVLCRNNAPLVKVAFALMRDGRPVSMSRSSLIQGLVSTIKKLDEDVPLETAIADWETEERAFLLEKKRYAALDALEDKVETIRTIMEEYNAQTKADLVKAVSSFIVKMGHSEGVHLSTIHAAKGREWDTVFFLNQHLIPGRWISEAADTGNEYALELLKQEENLRYVGITRALERLYFITVERKDKIISGRDAVKTRNCAG